MRDYRDAKTMAHALREELAAKHHKITVGESLEIIAHIFGVADWNTLSAIIKNTGAAPKRNDGGAKNGAVRFTRTLEETLHRSLLLATERGQKEATLEHLLLSLTADPEAAAVMEAQRVAPAALRKLLADSLKTQSPSETDRTGPTPSGAFQQVVQRAILHVQSSGGGYVTGADLLIEIFSEADSLSAQLLRDQGMDPTNAAEIVAAARAIARHDSDDPNPTRSSH